MAPVKSKATPPAPLCSQGLESSKPVRASQLLELDVHFWFSLHSSMPQVHGYFEDLPEPSVIEQGFATHLFETLSHF